MASFLRGLDAYPKTLDDVRVRTLSGAAVSLIASIGILYLVFAEFQEFRKLKTESSMYVDMSIGEKLAINFDVTFSVFPCAALHLDAMDISGYQQLDLDHNIYKQRMNADGTVHHMPKEKHVPGESTEVAAAFENGTKVEPQEYCGSCYGAGDEGECCNTCEDVRNAYRKKGWSFEQAMASEEGIAQCVRDNYIDDLNEQSENKEGCNLHGTIQVQKVAGNFHFGVGRNFQQAQMHIHDLMPLRNININLTHTINHLSFGTDYPGRQNPLDELERLQTHRTSMYQYFIKVVPTIYEYLGKEEIVNTNQYSVTDYKRDLEGGWDERGKLPGVFFFYDVSPIMVHYQESRTPMYHFITEICAIVGGAVTVRSSYSALRRSFYRKLQQLTSTRACWFLQVTGMIDSFIYRSHNAITKKLRLGKLG